MIPELQLLGLPLEVRYRIYTAFFGLTRIAVKRKPDGGLYIIALSEDGGIKLLQVCQQVRAEATPYLARLTRVNLLESRMSKHFRQEYSQHLFKMLRDNVRYLAFMREEGYPDVDALDYFPRLKYVEVRNYIILRLPVEASEIPRLSITSFARHVYDCAHSQSVHLPLAPFIKTAAARDLKVMIGTSYVSTFYDGVVYGTRYCVGASTRAFMSLTVGSTLFSSLAPKVRHVIRSHLGIKGDGNGQQGGRWSI